MTENRQPAHRFLAQIMCRYSGPMGKSCQSENHTQAAPSHVKLGTWVLRIYQNPEKVVTLYKQGISREEIAQRVWDEMCQEQDTIGVVMHKQIIVCDTCAMAVCQEWGGVEAAFMATTTAMVTRGAILLVADRSTEKAALAGNVPGNTTEQQILPLLDQPDILDIRFNR